MNIYQNLIQDFEYIVSKIDPRFINITCMKIYLKLQKNHTITQNINKHFYLMKVDSHFLDLIFILIVWNDLQYSIYMRLLQKK